MQATSAMPKIVQVTVDPVNVHVGDVQTLTAILSDPSPITSVVANIQTDNGTTTIPLSLVGPAALNDLAPRKYFVNADNQLVFARPIHQSEDNVAFAATGNEKYSAQWTVKDTHTARYVTVFTATDAQGNSNSATLGWTDAVCSWNGDNNNSGATTTISSTFGSQGCTFAGGVTDGVENGNLLIDAPVALVKNSNLVLNPGHSFSFSGSGQLSIQTGAELQFSEMYCSGSGWVTTYSSPADGTDEVPRSQLSNNVFPLQTAYFTTPTLTNYGSSTWNYNCAATVNTQTNSEVTSCTPQQNTYSSSSGTCTYGVCVSNPAYEQTSSVSSANCGGTYYTGCANGTYVNGCGPGDSEYTFLQNYQTCTIGGAATTLACN